MPGLCGALVDLDSLEMHRMKILKKERQPTRGYWTLQDRLEHTNNFKKIIPSHSLTYNISKNPGVGNWLGVLNVEND